MNKTKFFYFIIILLTIINLSISKEINIILSLREYFNSKLVIVLPESKISVTNNIAYDLTKRQGMNFYMRNGLGNLENDSLSYSGFKKPLIISLNLKSLINLLQVIQKK